MSWDGTVLVLRALGLGDALTGVPALRGIRRRWPGYRVVLAGPRGPGELLLARGVVDDVLPWTGLGALPRALLEAHGAGGAHVAVNLHGRGPQSHWLLAGTRPRWLLAFRCDEAGHDQGPQWNDSEHEVDRWCRLLGEVGGSCGPPDLRLRPDPVRGALPATVPDGAAGAVVVHPGAASGSRRWPAGRWRSVVAALCAVGHRVVVTGGPDEQDLTAAVAGAGALDLGGRLDLEQLLTLVGGARLLLCGDTGVAHLGTACGTPSVLLFGPTSPSTWGPVLDPHLHRVLWHAASDGAGAGPAGNPHGDAVDPRLAAVTADEVLDAADGLLHPAPA